MPLVCASAAHGEQVLQTGGGQHPDDSSPSQASAGKFVGLLTPVPALRRRRATKPFTPSIEEIDFKYCRDRLTCAACLRRLSAPRTIACLRLELPEKRRDEVCLV